MRRVPWVPLAILVLAAPSAADAQEAEAPPEAPPAAPADTGVSFDFQDADLRSVLTALAEAAGLSIVYSDLPQRAVTLRTARPVRPGEVRSLLERVVVANDLELTEESGVVHVFAPEQPEAEVPAGAEAEAAAPPPRLFIHRLDHADAETVARTLQSLFGLRGTGGTTGPPGGGPVGLSESLRRQSRAGYQAMEGPGQAPAPAARTAARRAPPEAGGQAAGTQAGGRAAGRQAGMSVALEGPVEIVPDSRSNSLLVLATPGDYETVRGAIDGLDTRPLQVLIEVMIAEVRLNRTDAFGTSLDVPVGEDGDGVGFSLQGLSVGDVALSVLGIGSVGASVVLRALSSSSDVTILSRPVVLAQNNEEARILVGDQRPFIQIQRSLPTDQAVRDQVVQYRSVGTELIIDPTINRDGYVNLRVLQSVSSATAEVQFGAPVINTRESETDVLVKDGHTAVLGGLVDHQREETRSGVPLLKDLPVLGGLFGSVQHRKVATELFILLTPHIIRTDEDLEATREGLRAGTETLRKRMPEPTSLLEAGRRRLDGDAPRSAGQARPPLPSPDTVPVSPPEP